MKLLRVVIRNFYLIFVSEKKKFSSILSVDYFPGHMSIAQILIDNGANIDAKCDHGRTPLHAAARFGIFEISCSEWKCVNLNHRTNCTNLHRQ